MDMDAKFGFECMHNYIIRGYGLTFRCLLFYFIFISLNFSLAHYLHDLVMQQEGERLEKHCETLFHILDKV